MIKFGDYIVVEDGKNFYGIYYGFAIATCLISHRTSWRSACKVAKLLNQAYEKGREHYRDEWY
jgi:hypothetical protein